MDTPSNATSHPKWRWRDQSVTHPLLQQGSADGHPLLQVLDLPVVLGVGVDLDFALVGVEQLQFLLQLHQQGLVLRFLGLVQAQLQRHKE